MCMRGFISFPHCHEGPTFHDRLHRHYVYIFLNYTPITLALQTTPKASQVCNNFAKPMIDSDGVKVILFRNSRPVLGHSDTKK